MSRIVKAERQQRKLRLALFGPTGSGKTLTALKIARGLVGPEGKILLIDTENYSSTLYADQVGFDVLPMTTFGPGEYVKALEEGEASGYDVIVIDSLSHAWSGRGGALELVDRAASRSQSGSSFNAWRQVTPQHNAMVDALVHCKCHLMVTMRSKMEYVQEKDPQSGRTVVKKIGLQPVQRDGMEYEFDICGDMDLEHQWTTGKTRCSMLDAKVIPCPDEHLGRQIIAWLREGKAPPAAPPEDIRQLLGRALMLWSGFGSKDPEWSDVTRQARRAAGVPEKDALTDVQVRQLYDFVRAGQISGDNFFDAVSRNGKPPTEKPAPVGATTASATPAPTPAPQAQPAPATPAANGGAGEPSGAAANAAGSPTDCTLKAIEANGSGEHGGRKWQRFRLRTSVGDFTTYSSTVAKLAEASLGWRVRLTWQPDTRGVRTADKLEPLSAPPGVKPAEDPAPAKAPVTVPDDAGELREEDIPF